MKHFSETQIGWWLVVPIMVVAAGFTLLYAFQWGNHPLDQTTYLVFMTLFGVVLALFATMRTTVDAEAVVVMYGVGIIRRRIPVEAIASVRILPAMPFVVGYGLRLTADGVILNIQPSALVGCTLRSGQVVRIGTRQPEALAQRLASTVKA